MSSEDIRFEEEVKRLALSTSSTVDVQNDMFNINNQLIIHRHAFQQVVECDQNALIFKATKMLAGVGGELKSVPDEVLRQHLEKFQIKHRIVYEGQKPGNWQQFKNLLAVPFEKSSSELTQHEHHRILEFLSQHGKSTMFVRKASELAQQISAGQVVNFDEFICLIEYGLAKFNHLSNQTLQKFDEFFKESLQIELDNNNVKVLKPKLKAKLTNYCLQKFCKLADSVDSGFKKTNSAYIRDYVDEKIIDANFLQELKLRYLSDASAFAAHNLVGALEAQQFSDANKVISFIRDFLVTNNGFIKFCSVSHTLCHFEKHSTKSLENGQINVDDLLTYLLRSKMIMLACEKPEFTWSPDGKARRFTYFCAKGRVIVLEIGSPHHYHKWCDGQKKTESYLIMFPISDCW